MIETAGWDTHAQQRGRLGLQLAGLDGMIGALQAGLGALGPIPWCSSRLNLGVP